MPVIIHQGSYSIWNTATATTQVQSQYDMARHAMDKALDILISDNEWDGYESQEE